MQFEEHSHCFLHFLASKDCPGHFWAPPFIRNRVAGLGMLQPSQPLLGSLAHLEERLEQQRAEDARVAQSEQLQELRALRAHRAAQAGRGCFYIRTGFQSTPC